MPNNQEKGIFTPAEGGPEVGPTGNNHLLVIAIDEYVHCPKLRNCVKDAKEFAELLWSLREPLLERCRIVAES